MRDRLTVLVGDLIAGELTKDRNNRLEFTYEPSYVALEDPTPLSVSMPAAIRTHRGAGVTAWLWGLLPDNPAVVARWAQRYHVGTGSPFGLLSSPVGADCPGAVRFVAPEGLDALLAGPAGVEWLSDADVAQRLADLRTDATSWLGAGFTGRFSLGGAQAKTALLYADGKWGQPSGSAATSHILKPAISGLDDHDLNEHLCLRAAGRCGLIVSHTEVRRFGEEQAIVVERYDRVVSDAGLLRVHQEDLCQALGRPPAEKYEAEGGPGPAEIVRLFRRVMAAAEAEETVWRFADALIWNWIIGGTDAHARNYSLLLAGATVRLAPLYDVASALPYREHERRLRLAMKFGSDYKLVGQRSSTWTTLAAALGVDREQLVARAEHLLAAAPDAFADVAHEVSGIGADLPARLTDAVAQRASRCVPSLPT